MTAAITLMEAYLIETPISMGMDKKTLLAHLDASESEKLEAFVGEFDYKEFVQAYQEQKDRLTAAIQTGYAITFVSITGIKRLLELKFGLDGEKDFETCDDKVLHIPLNRQQLAVFEKMLSPNWRVMIEEIAGELDHVNVYHRTL